MYLDEPELFDLRRSLETIRDIVRFLQKSDDDEEEGASPYPCLKRLARDITVFPQLIAKINGILSPYGKSRTTPPQNWHASVGNWQVPWEASPAH